MSNKHLKPGMHHHKGQPNVWWYESPGGIVVGTLTSTVRAYIPWRSIRAALKRKDKPDE